MTLFYCKTLHATVFKYTFNILFHNIPTVPICISKEGFSIFSQTDSGYIFNVHFPADKFSEWSYNSDEPIYFGLGTLNSHDFKELTSKSTIEMTIHDRKSPLECIALKITVVNGSRNLIKKFTLFSEEIPFFKRVELPKGPGKLSMKPQDFTSLCKGFKTGIIHMKCDQAGFSIMSKLDGVREKCFLFPERLDIDIDAIFSADKFLGIIKLAMCVNKTVNLFIAENNIVVAGESLLGCIEIMLLF